MIQAIATVLDFAPAAWTPAQRIVAVALADRVNPDTLECYPSIADVSRRTGLSPRQVQRILRQLEKEGVVTRLGQKTDGTKWGANRWVWRMTVTPTLWKKSTRKG